MEQIEHIVIVGAGGFGREVASYIEQLPASAGVRIAGFLDDTRARGPALSEGFPYPLLGGIDGYVPQPGHALIVAIGDPKAKLRIARNLEERGARFYTLVHPTAVVARTAQLGKGVIVCPFAFVSADTKLADFVTVNVYTSIGHDASVGEGSTLSGHVDITGFAKLGECVFVGSNAAVLPRVEVGAQSTIGAGAIVVRRVQPGTTIYATPSRKL
jgi:sugar O-acyltransferase (sialic acid O-acetyltransferase NeuD family)